MTGPPEGIPHLRVHRCHWGGRRCPPQSTVEWGCTESTDTTHPSPSSTSTHAVGWGGRAACSGRSGSGDPWSSRHGQCRWVRLPGRSRARESSAQSWRWRSHKGGATMTRPTDERDDRRARLLEECAVELAGVDTLHVSADCAISEVVRAKLDAEK